MTTVIRVTGEAPYDVVVGNGLADRLPALLPGADRIAIVADEAVAAYARRLRDALLRDGRAVHDVWLTGGEAAKDLLTAGRLWDELGSLRITRSDALVAVGGGATTDLVGFVASAWLRGVRVVHVPTTLLGMVDAAVGGKTGVNTAAGKNLVGAFHPPAGVLVDLDALDQLPVTQWVNGMAEVVKAGLIGDPTILDLVEADPDNARSPDGAPVRELIERSIRVKAAVVSADPRETGRREALNYGHTLGHAIERREGYRLPHGQAVSVGLCYAATLGRLAGRLPAPDAARHRQVLESVGLPTSYPVAAWPELLDAMRMDKKARGATLRFVVLDRIGEPRILEGPDEGLLEAAYREVAR